MAYTPTTWETGDLITAEKMNKLEQGVQNEQAGPAGEDGAAAGFGTPTATVDANTGTPSVTVSTSGPDTAKGFHLSVQKSERRKRRFRGAGTCRTVLYTSCCKSYHSGRGKTGCCDSGCSSSADKRGI